MRSGTNLSQTSCVGPKGGPGQTRLPTSKILSPKAAKESNPQSLLLLLPKLFLPLLLPLPLPEVAGQPFGPATISFLEPLPGLFVPLPLPGLLVPLPLLLRFRCWYLRPRMVCVYVDAREEKVVLWWREWLFKDAYQCNTIRLFLTVILFWIFCLLTLSPWPAQRPEMLKSR